ncbi:MAG: hypothetical protein IT381_11960 [Deltaproteobacteria bacterium]|nr:hypothetical protein [Deltaproteobacteria bacterium]
MSSLRDKLVGLVAFRLAIAAVALATIATSDFVFEPDAELALPFQVSLAVTVVFVSALGNAVAIRLGVVHSVVAALQVLVDLTLLSVVVWYTGASASPFAFLYCIVVIEAAGVFPRFATMIAAALCAATLIVLAAVHAWISAGTVVALRANVAPLAAQVAAVVTVAWLASSLALEGSRIKARLERTESALARLGDLHERVLLGLSSGIVSVDATDVIGFINPAAGEILNVDSVAALGKRLVDIAPMLVRLTPSDRGETQLELGGKTRTLGLSVVPLLGEGGAPVGRTLIFRDLTEIREMEARARTNERLASLGRLAANLAHEIRNPLGSLSGAIEMIAQNERLRDDERALTAIVLRDVARLNALVTDFLEYARPQTAERVACDLGVIADETVRMFGHDASVGARQLALTRGEGSLEVLVDPGQIKQLLFNSLRNAVQATDGNDGRVEVQVRREEPHVLLAVRDNGSGISDEAAERVFEPFFSAGKRSTGLGLAIVAQLVQQNEGQVSVRREAGSTAFEYRFRASTRSR